MTYIPVLFLLLVGLAVGTAVLLLTTFLGAGIPNRRKNMPFECGVPGYGSSRNRFSVRFYLVAILFLLFDVEGIFFFPWAVVYKKYLTINAFILVEMGVFATILLVGYFYVLKKGALEWE
jgi:NADH-quinone oxidoreductase subunit A